ncbi:acetyl-CoA carboxylase biotin carboxyl carrier protein [Natronocella acetinitrilica]|uniref:Biotin carboxyl carrier protein of acetyl-CoA carboxylase n=1 Tax=Natronocella acetinitrilica TaxID=414046 RepID=A0AAE3G2R4_9GAMM|nr:acetyl-CoA carboxylase [Natronocella acetinitrilica]MCP1673631.1 acetyl-CoA carboxylase biotin carboxyl carrier protein [Natronocella acetinitrilica]
MSLTPQQVVEILERLRDSDCESFHLTLGDTRIEYRRSGGPGAAAPTTGASVEQSAAAAAPTPAPAAGTKPTTATPKRGKAAAPSQGQQIVAPMAGVFYRRPSPDEPPFVEEGSIVKAGDPVCVIEVMKLFSTVHAEVAGRVIAIHVDDAESVDPNTPLFSIEPGDG